MELYLQGPNGEEYDLAFIIKEPDPRDDSSTITVYDLVSKVNQIAFEDRRNLHNWWYRLVPDHEAWLELKMAEFIEKGDLTSMASGVAQAVFENFMVWLQNQ
jgi:hypothetical protein